MRKIFRMVLCFALIFSMCSGLQYVNATTENNINVILNGNNLVFDQSPIIENGRTLVPMRTIFESMGATIEWNEETQSVFGKKGNNNFKLQIGNNKAYHNDTEITLDVAPVILNGRTLVPVRFVAESLNAKVDWDEINNSVVIVETKDVIEEINPKVQIEMESGKKIVIELYPKYAPITVANFLALVGQGFYDGLGFHRVIPGFMIQGGDPKGDGTGGSIKNIDGEFSQNGFTQNTILHTRGVISMARAQDMNSASSQFFIMHADAPFLDGAYAAFGKVISGMDAVDEIASSPVAPGGEGSMPVNKPKMKKVIVLP